MFDKRLVLHYYKSQTFRDELWLPDKPQFRQFKGKDINGKWNIAGKIYNKDDLITWILNNKICDIFISTALWSSPQRVEMTRLKSKGYEIADNLMYNHRVVIDVDSQSPHSINELNRARITFKNAHNITKRIFKKEFIIFSGYKGFQGSYIDHNIDSIHDNTERLKYIHENRKYFIDEYLKKEMIDKDVTTDIYRVTRLPSSINSNTGLICEVLKQSDLMQPIEKYLSNAHSVYGYSGLEMYDKLVQMTERGKNPLLSRLIKPEEVSANPNTSLYKISTQVIGTKNRAVLVLIYKKEFDAEREIKRLQKNQKIGDAYLFDNGHYIQVMTTKAITQERAIKLYKRSSSMNRKFGVSTGYNSFYPLGYVFSKVIKRESKGEHSLPHLNFLNKFTKIDCNNTTGEDKLKVWQKQ